MSTIGWVAIAVVVVLVLVALWAWSRGRRSTHLRERFGPEYDRAVETSGSPTKAERELEQREQRHDALSIQPLDPKHRAVYRARWEQVQARFVDDPSGALRSADTLVTQVMADRGYPVGGFDQRAADLSVEHGDVLGHYRAAHSVDLRSGRASTESMREAFVHYRAMFTDLLGDPVVDVRDPDAVRSHGGTETPR